MRTLGKKFISRKIPNLQNSNSILLTSLIANSILRYNSYILGFILAESKIKLR